MYYFDLVPEPLAFRGYGEYAVRQVGAGAWAWLNAVTNTTMATLRSEHDSSFPIGRLTWITEVSNVLKCTKVNTNKIKKNNCRNAVLYRN